MLDPSLYACAPHVAPATLRDIVRVESSGNAIAINVNLIRGRPRFAVPRIQTASDAAQAANRAIAQGYNVDLGLMQVNSRNLRSLGYTVEQMLSDPCLNVRAGAQILTDNYRRASRIHGPGQQALLAALSAYNTGDFQRGFSNGYVGRYFRVRSAQISIRPLAVPGPAVDIQPSLPNPYTADLSVYSRESTPNGTTDSHRPEPPVRGGHTPTSATADEPAPGALADH